MLRIFGWVFGIIALLLVLAIAAGAGMIYYVHNADQRQLVSDFVKDKSGLDISFGEKLEIRLWPELSVQATDIVIADYLNDETPLLTVKSVSVLGNLRGLLQQGPLLKSVVVEAPKVDLLVQQDGRANWQPPRKGRSSGGQADVAGLLALVPQLRVSDAALRMEDRTTGQLQELTEFQVNLAQQGAGAAQLTINGLVDRLPLSLTADFNLAEARRMPLSVQLIAPSVRASAKGVVRGLPNSPQFSGSLTAESADILPLLKRFQPHLPLQAGALPFNFQADIEQKAKSLMVNSFALNSSSFGDLRGKLNLTTGALPYKLDGALQSARLDLEKMGVCGASGSGAKGGSGRGGAGGKSKPKTPWSEAPLDFSFVQLIQGDMGFELSDVRCGALPFKAMKGQLVLDDQRVELKGVELTSRAGGALDISAKIGLTGNRNGGATITAKDFDVMGVMGEAGKRASVPLQGTVDMSFNGPSTAAWARSLDGKIDLSANGGRLPQTSVLGLLEWFSSKKAVAGGDMAIRSMVVQYAIENGVARSEALSLDTPNFMLTGDGKVDVANWTINHTFTPDLAGGAVRVPVAVRGSLNKPSVVPQAVNSTNVGAGVGALVGGPVGAGLGALLGQQLQGGEQASPTQLNIDTKQLEQELENSVKSIFQGLGLQ